MSLNRKICNLGEETMVAEYKKMYTATIVWGKEYLDYYIQLSLPTLLAPGNIPCLAKQYELVFLIYTFRADKEKLENAQEFIDLRMYVQVEFIQLDEIDYRYLVDGPIARWQNSCYNHALMKAYEASSGLILLAPDTLYSDGTFDKLQLIVNRGYKAILSRVLNVNRHSVIGQLRSAKQGSIISIYHRDMVNLWCQHAHVCSDYWFEDTHRFNNESPCVVGWKAGETGVVLCASQIHALYVEPRNAYQVPNAEFLSGSVDTILAHNAVDKEFCYIIQDSDEGVQLELRSVLEQSIISFDRPNLPLIAFGYWRLDKLGQQNYEYFKKPIYFHTNDGDALAKEEAEKKAATFFHDALTMSNFKDFREFMTNCKEYYNSLRAEASFCIIGDSPVATLTNELLILLGQPFFYLEKNSTKDEKNDAIVMLALCGEQQFEAQYSYLECLGKKFGYGFITSPMMYRTFRVSYAKEMSLPWQLRLWIWYEDYLKFVYCKGWSFVLRVLKFRVWCFICSFRKKVW